MTVYSSLWATVLMLAFLFFSGVADFGLPRSAQNVPRSGGEFLSPTNLAGKVIVLDPGHGGSDPAL